MAFMLSKQGTMGTYKLTVVDAPKLARLLMLFAKISCVCFKLLGE